MAYSLSLRETGALILNDAATAIDMAEDSAAFLRALEHNRQVWNTLKDISECQSWGIPDRRQTEFALGATMRSGISDHDIDTLLDINRSVSAALADGSIDLIRLRAYYIWENQGHPQGQDMDHWLLAEMQLAATQPAGVA